MQGDALNHVLYLVAILLLVASGWWHLRDNPKKELKHAFIWLTVIVLLVIGWSLVH